MMNGLYVWSVIGGAAVITYLLRLSFVILLDKFTMPAVVERSLRFVPAAVITAIVVPALVFREGQLDLSVGNERLLAGLLAAVVAYYSRNILVTIAAGMVALWLIQWLMG
ncbi:MAG: AzlD domain-containing protein [Anaerolineales bacterium]|nr:AzlD domain-containing protein [Anaerolineales bacterium]